ncbi:hypothetical protein Ate02nite_58700 [Paractinoplanes tereljensis]|uniref:Uncharacterized protein n=1 Tax=Paractinoplanes tereljensis TaxID=571912 RepID=A0A919NQE5_9ACTN|nr:hypothetical protein Ate02nite_58700 [Actinoplanes tereljensis]
MAARQARRLLPNCVYGATAVPDNRKIGTPAARHNATSADTCRCWLVTTVSRGAVSHAPVVVFKM